jgi:O-antigen ligase
LFSDKTLGALALWVVLLMVFGFQIQLLIPLGIGARVQPFSIGFRFIYLLLSIYILFIAVVKNKPSRLTYGIAFLLFFWIIYSIRVIYDISIRELYLLAQPPASPFYYYSYIFGSGLIPVLAILYTAKYIDFSKQYILFYIFSAAQMAAMLYVVFTSFEEITIEMVRNRAQVENDDDGIFLNPIILGRFGSIAAILGLSSLFLPVQRKHRAMLWVLSPFLIVSGGFLMTLGGSRGPLIAFLAAFILLLYYHFSNRIFVFTFVAKWVIGVVTVFSLISNYLLQSIDYRDYAILYRIVDTQVVGGKEARNTEWTIAWGQFLDNPVAGDQMFNYYDWQYPHNVVIESFMATGLVGGIPFCIVLLIFIYKLVKMRNNSFKSQTIGVIGLIMLISFLVSGGLYTNSEFWSMLAVVIGVGVDRTQTFQV